MVHGDPAGLHPLPSTEGAWHMPGCSVGISGGSPDMVDWGQGPAGTSSFRGILRQGA